jgi:acyl-CoA thioesterase
MAEDEEDMKLARHRAAELHAADETSRALGISLEKIAPGRATVAMRFTEHMTNGHGIGHGGYVFLLADAAFAYACNSRQATNVAHTAQVTFLRPVAAGDHLIAEAAERERYGRYGIYDVTVRRTEDGVVVAEFRGQSQAITGSPR